MVKLYILYWVKFTFLTGILITSPFTLYNDSYRHSLSYLFQIKRVAQWYSDTKTCLNAPNLIDTDLLQDVIINKGKREGKRKRREAASKIPEKKKIRAE